MERMRTHYAAEDLIAILNRHRHDWMNDLQVLFGYIQMNKQDKIKAYMHRLSDKLTRESLVAKLADPELVAYLLRFRAVCDRLQLEVDPAGEIDLTKIGLPGVRAAGWIPRITESFGAAADPEEAGQNRLSVALDWDGSRLAVHFAYRGGYVPDVLKAALLPVLDEVRTAGGEAVWQEGDKSADVRILIGTAD